MSSAICGGGTLGQMFVLNVAKSSVAGTTFRNFIVSQWVRKSSPIGRFNRP